MWMQCPAAGKLQTFVHRNWAVIALTTKNWPAVGAVWSCSCVSQSVLIDCTPDLMSLTFVSKYRRASTVCCKQHGPLLRPLYEGEGKLHDVVGRKQLSRIRRSPRRSMNLEVWLPYLNTEHLSASQYFAADNWTLTRTLWVCDLSGCCTLFQLEK